MHAFFQKLRPVIRWAVTYPAIVLAVALGLSVLAFTGARHLRIDTDFANLLPQDYPSVEALERLRQTVGGESEAAVAIRSASFEANRRFAEDFIPRALALRPSTEAEPFFYRVEYRRDTEFLENNALYFATENELNDLEAYLEGLTERARLEANPFYFDLEDDANADETSPEDSAAAELEATYDRIVGKPYPISADSTVMVLRFYPSGSQTNIGFIRQAYSSLDSLIAEMNLASYAPEMEVVTAGRLLRQLIEIDSVQKDVAGSFGAGVGFVILTVVLYFLYKSYRARAGSHRFSARILLTTLARAPVLALLIALPLLMSLSWTGAIAYLAYGKLNLMTSTLGLVLFGLGIDYGIHFYARYSEERARGKGIVAAAETTFLSTGQAIAVGAFSTAAALYVLVLADFKGFSEFGFIAGTGVLLALVSMTIILPAFLSLFERLRLLNFGEEKAEDLGHDAKGRPYPAFRPIVIASLVAVVLAFVFLPRARFEYNFGALEPEYEAYNARAAIVGMTSTGGDNRRNPAYVVTDSPEEAAAITRIVEAKQTQKQALIDSLNAGLVSREERCQDEYDCIQLIRAVESLQQRFPLTPEAQERRLARLEEIRTLLQDDFLTAEPSEDLDRIRRAASTAVPIGIDEIPEALRRQFTTRSGEIGNFVMIYPEVGLSDGRNSIAFSDEIGTITTEKGETHHAGSTSLVAADMLRLMMREAPWMILATFVMVVLLMWLNFGSLRWMLLSIIPLIVGVLWMLLGMELLGLKLNFYNLVVLPAILGIGNDAGAHFVHRYREEGPRSLRFILRSTGEHVLMSSITTMIGFGGLLLSFHPGLRSIGELAVLGIFTTLLAAIFFLPALLQWLEVRQNVKPAEVAG